MTKKQLLDMIDKSTFKLDKNKKSVYNKFYPLLKATLRFCPDELELEPASSLKDINDAGKFESFITTNSKNAIEEKFKSILTDLNTFADGYISRNPERVRNVATALSYSNDKTSKRRKRNKVFSIIVLTVFVVLSAAIAVFALLDNFEIIDSGNKIAGFCGICDFIVGIVSIVYERIDDSKKNAFDNISEQAVNKGDITALVPDYPNLSAESISIVDRHSERIAEAGDNSYIDQSIREDNSTHIESVNINVEAHSILASQDVKSIEQKLDEIKDAIVKSGKSNDNTERQVVKLKNNLTRSDSNVPTILQDTARDARIMLASAKCNNEAVLKKADELADSLVTLQKECCVESESGENCEMVLLRIQIYCGALQNGYNDICNNVRAGFINVKGYRKKLVETTSTGYTTLNDDNLKLLEKRVIDTLSPDPETVKSQADDILEKLGETMSGGSRECKVAFSEYCDAIRQQYNDICLNRNTSFVGLKAFRNALIAVAENLSERYLHDLEGQIMSILRPDTESVKSMADNVLDEYFENITKL